MFNVYIRHKVEFPSAPRKSAVLLRQFADDLHKKLKSLETFKEPMWYSLITFLPSDQTTNVK